MLTPFPLLHQRFCTGRQWFGFGARRYGGDFCPHPTIHVSASSAPWRRLLCSNGRGWPQAKQLLASDIRAGCSFDGRFSLQNAHDITITIR